MSPAAGARSESPEDSGDDEATIAPERATAAAASTVGNGRTRGSVAEDSSLSSIRGPRAKVPAPNATVAVSRRRRQLGPMTTPCRILIRCAVAAAIAALTYGSPARAQTPDVRFVAPDWGAAPWLKGNTHTHTTESDGDSAPEVVIDWYRSHGYDFLVLSDHNVFTDPERFRHLQDSAFLLIAGEEVTSSFERRPVHVNGLGIPGLVEPRTDSTMVDCSATCAHAFAGCVKTSGACVSSAAASMTRSS